MRPDEAETPPHYEVELSEAAEAEVDAIFLGRMQFGQKTAERWHTGLGKALRTLAIFPKGYPIASESEKIDEGIRQMIYGKGSAAYRILYHIIEPQDDEPGRVRVLHVRHASQQRAGHSSDEQ